MVYRIQIVRVAQKQLLSSPKKAQLEIARTIDSLGKTPRPPGCKKLHGAELWRLRLGRYRVVYQIDNEARQIIVVKIALRREDTYQGL